MSSTSSELRAEFSGTSRLQHERQRQIYVLALKHGAVDVSDLARRFDVTTETIRRDLSDMQTRDLVRRVHGGAVPIETHHHEPNVDARDMQNAIEKAAIANEALKEIPEKGSVILDSGSTTHYLAEVFHVDRDVHVVTNSLVSALTLARRGLKELSVPGGGIRTDTLAMVDTHTVDAIRLMRVDVLFLSCDGLSYTRGLTTPYRHEWALKRAMIESARKIVALVDQSKFGNDQMFSHAGLREIDVLITDHRVDDDTVGVLSEHGIDVRRA